MGLTNVWIQTQADGLVRADHVTGIEAHQTPALAGKPSHWLLDVVLPTVTGSGAATSGPGREWAVGPVHRTLIQTPDHPADAPAALARLLAQLDPITAAGVITATISGGRAADASRSGRDDTPPDIEKPAGATVAGEASRVRFEFQPFPRPPAASHDTESHYL